MRVFHPISVLFTRRQGQPFTTGESKPQADIQMTRAVVDIATPLGISVHDHIIGKNGHASLKGIS